MDPYASYPTSSVIVKVGNEVLLTIRAIEPFKGTLDIPGGFLKYGEDPRIGAIREFKEEIGISLYASKLKFLTIGMGTYDYQGQDQYTINVIYFVEMDQKFAAKAADDVADLIWAPISEDHNFGFPYLTEIWKEIKKQII